MCKVVLMSGPAGSGKTTIAKLLEDLGNFVYVSSDEIREELWGNAADQRHPNKVFQIFYERARKAVMDGHNCVLDATFLTTKARKEALRALEFFEPPVVGVKELGKQIARQARAGVERGECKDGDRQQHEAVNQLAPGRAGDPAGEGFQRSGLFRSMADLHLLLGMRYLRLLRGHAFRWPAALRSCRRR